MKTNDDAAPEPLDTISFAPPSDTDYLALEARVERMELSLRAAKVYFWEWDIASDVIRWSGNLEGELLLASPPKTVAEFKALVHPEDSTIVADRIEAALLGPSDYFAEFRMVRSDGSIRWTSSRAHVIRDANGVPVHLVGLDRDISEKREMISRLEASEAQLRAQFDSLSAAEKACQSGTWDWQLDRNRVYVSDSYRSIYGLADDEIVTYETWLEKIVPEDRPEVARQTQEHFESGDRYDIEFRILHPTKGVRWIVALGTFFSDNQGKPIRFTGINIDITERVTVAGGSTPGVSKQQSGLTDEQRSLLALSKQLEGIQADLSGARARIAHGEKLKLVGQFVANIVHDINNLLAGVGSAGALLRRRLPEGPHVSIVDQMDRMVVRGAKLVRQLLDISRQDSPLAERIDIVRFVAAELELYRRVAGPAITLTVLRDVELWPVFAPPSNLQAVLLNLIANARDAQPSGGVIRISASNCPANHRPSRLPAADYVVVTISDDGIGMPPEILKRAGEPFFTTKSKGNGTGLGLASIRDFARAHGGEMMIESSPGRGTSVLIYMPRAPVAGETVSVPDSPIDPGRHGGANILLVETDDAFRQHIAATLQSLNYNVVQAHNADVARVLILQANNFDLAILGLQIGNDSGTRLAQRLREIKVSLPIIFLMGATTTKTPKSELVFGRPLFEALLAQGILEKLGRSPPSLVTAETLRL